MTEAVLGTFSEVRFVKTRSVMQIIVEVPIEAADSALKALGGIPQPSEERWIGLALAPKERKEITKSALIDGDITRRDKDRRPFNSLPPSQQAGIRCNDEQFQDYIWAMSDAQVGIEETATTLCKKYLGVKSRAELDTNDLAAQKWRKLEADYQAYLTDLRYAGSPGL